MINVEVIVRRGSISCLTEEKEKEDSVSQGSVMRKMRTMMPVTVAGRRRGGKGSK